MKPREFWIGYGPCYLKAFESEEDYKADNMNAEGGLHVREVVELNTEELEVASKNWYFGRIGNPITEDAFKAGANYVIAKMRGDAE